MAKRFPKKENQEYAMRLVLSFAQKIFFDISHREFEGKDRVTNAELLEVIKLLDR